MTIDSAYNYVRNKDKLLANLINIIEGLTCDGRLSESEVLFLDTWLLESQSLSENYYVQCIRSKIFDILTDGCADEQELTEFKASEGIVDGLSTTLPNDLINKCDFNGKNVCLTGKFLCGSRRQCSSDIEKLGGKIVDSVTQKLDVLIVGALSSKDWKFQSFGRKIEMAVDLRDNKNIPLIIISEEQWQSLIHA